MIDDMFDFYASLRKRPVWQPMPEPARVQQARYLADLVTGAPELESLAPVSTTVVCFRYRGRSAVPDGELNVLNQELLDRLPEGGVAVPSHTVLAGG